MFMMEEEEDSKAFKSRPITILGSNPVEFNGIRLRRERKVKITMNQEGKNEIPEDTN